MRKIILLYLFGGILWGAGVSIQAQNKQTIDKDSLLVKIETTIKARNLDKARELIDSAATLKIADDDLYALGLNFYKARILVIEGKDEEALPILLSGSSKLDRMPLSKEHSRYAGVTGRVFSRAASYDKALKYFKKGIGYSLQRNDSLATSHLYLNIGSVYHNLKEMDSAEVYYQKVISFYPDDKKNSFNLKTLGTVYLNLVGIAVRKGELELAKEYGDNAIELLKEGGDTLKLAGALGNMGSLNMYMGDLETSKKQYLDALGLLDNLEKKTYKSREVKALTVDNISQVYYLQGDYKTAYDYLFDNVDLVGEIADEKAESKITEIEAKYNLEEKENERLLEIHKRENAEIVQYVFAGISVILLIVIWLFIRTSRLKKQKSDLEILQEQMRQDRAVEVIKNEAKIKFLHDKIDVKEAERRYIAEILHDNVSSLLSSANMHLYSVKTELKNNAPDEVSKIEMIISEASDKIRDLSHKLISSILLKFGLASAVENLCEKYSTSKLVFNSESKNIKRYKQSFEIKMYNIIEELITNVLKHSQAEIATIDLWEEEGGLKIQITDNGVGFDVDEILDGEGFGLIQIKSKIEEMGGAFKIKSYSKTGTQVYINVPVQSLLK